MKKASLLENKIQRKEDTKRLKKKQLLFTEVIIREKKHRKELIESGAFDPTGYCLEGCEKCTTKYCHALKGKSGVLPGEKPCEDCSLTIEVIHFVNSGLIHLFPKETLEIK